MDAIIALSAPIIVSIVGYLLHRSISQIDQDLKEAKAEIKKLSKLTQDLDKSVSLFQEAIKAQFELQKYATDGLGKSLREKIMEIEKIQTKLETKFEPINQNYGKVLVILDKVVKNLKKQ